MVCYNENRLSKKIQARVEDASQRMSDYLFYCGFQEQEAKALMERLSSLNRNIRWQKPDKRIKPYKSQILENKLR